MHATTIADNTLIEMNGALTGLITTEGFRDEMEYRRGFKESIWDVRLEPPPQITPRRRRLTVPERILFDGSVHKPLDENAVRECCRRLKKQKVESVAISFLFSFVNPSARKARRRDRRRGDAGRAHLLLASGAAARSRIRSHQHHGGERLYRRLA